MLVKDAPNLLGVCWERCLRHSEHELSRYSIPEELTACECQYIVMYAFYRGLQCDCQILTLEQWRQ